MSTKKTVTLTLDKETKKKAMSILQKDDKSLSGYVNDKLKEFVQESESTKLQKGGKKENGIVEGNCTSL